MLQQNFQCINTSDNILDLVASQLTDELCISQERELVKIDKRSHPSILISLTLLVFNCSHTPLIKKNFSKGDYLAIYN